MSPHIYKVSYSESLCLRGAVAQYLYWGRITFFDAAGINECSPCLDLQHRCLQPLQRLYRTSKILYLLDLPCKYELLSHDVAWYGAGVPKSALLSGLRRLHCNFSRCQGVRNARIVKVALTCHSLCLLEPWIA